MKIALVQSSTKGGRERYLEMDNWEQQFKQNHYARVINFATPRHLIVKIKVFPCFVL